MAKSKRQSWMSDAQYQYFKDWYDDSDDSVKTTFDQTSSDNSIVGAVLTAGAMVAAGYVVGSLLDAQQQEQIRGEVQDAKNAAPDELKSQIEASSLIYDQLQNTLLPVGNEPVDGVILNTLFNENYILTQDEVTQYNNLLQDTAQLGRVSDPYNVENKAFSDAQQIQEMVGTFGSTEGRTQGTLSTWQGQEVKIPWITMGDEKVCDDCAAAEADGPYLPEDYPPPFHYLDRCYPGDAEISMPDL
jgi:hypothetical protein